MLKQTRDLVDYPLCSLFHPLLGRRGLVGEVAEGGAVVEELCTPERVRDDGDGGTVQREEVGRDGGRFRREPLLLEQDQLESRWRIQELSRSGQSTGLDP